MTEFITTKEQRDKIRQATQQELDEIYREIAK